MKNKRCLARMNSKAKCFIATPIISLIVHIQLRTDWGHFEKSNIARWFPSFKDYFPAWNFENF